MARRLVAGNTRHPARDVASRHGRAAARRLLKATAIPRQQGFAYIWALMLVLIMGIYLAQVGEAWQSKLQRNKEEELLRVGNEIRLAIKQYSEQNAGGGMQYPKTLNDLVQDPRVPFPRRFLRKAYKDPMTGNDWAYIGGPGGGFMGVNSKSELKPLKTHNFLVEYTSFQEAKTYQDWRFAHWPNQGGNVRK